MSFIVSTIKCPCGKYMNIALGTFGSGMPEKCAYCGKREKFENVSDGWLADKYGNINSEVTKNV